MISFLWFSLFLSSPLLSFSLSLFSLSLFLSSPLLFPPTPPGLEGCPRRGECETQRRREGDRRQERARVWRKHAGVQRRTPTHFDQKQRDRTRPPRPRSTKKQRTASVEIEIVGQCGVLESATGHGAALPRPSLRSVPDPASENNVEPTDREHGPRFATGTNGTGTLGHVGYQTDCP